MTQVSDLHPEDIARLQHESWLNHPSTIQLLNNLEYMKKTSIAYMTRNSGNVEVPDSQFRLAAQKLNTFDTVSNSIKSWPIFLKWATDKETIK